jgi:hypothetical protein
VQKLNLYFNNHSPVVIRMKIAALPPHFDVIVSLFTLFILSPAISCVFVLIVREREIAIEQREKAGRQNTRAQAVRVEYAHSTPASLPASTPRPHPHQLQIKTNTRKHATRITPAGTPGRCLAHVPVYLVHRIIVFRS